MKYEHRDYLVLVAVTDTKYEKPRTLLSLNPSLFSESEIIAHRITIQNELKKLNSITSDMETPIKPGLYVAILNVRHNSVSFKKFGMNMNPDVFREYKKEVQEKMEEFFGMEPEPKQLYDEVPTHLYFACDAATGAYVNQDRR